MFVPTVVRGWRGCLIIHIKGLKSLIFFLRSFDVQQAVVGAFMVDVSAPAGGSVDLRNRQAHKP